MQEEQKEQKDAESAQKPVLGDIRENADKTYDVEGLLAGGGAGLIVGLIVSFDVIFAIEIGMFAGLIVGTRIKK
jgi:hypothetical protein